MALHITNPRADKLARELAKQTGETISDAVVKALEERLERNGDARQKEIERRRADIEEAVARIRKLPVLDDRTDDEILGYDEDGLPT